MIHKVYEIFAHAAGKMAADVKRAYKHAAIIGMGLALLCHTVPPQYRVLCDHLATFCKGLEP